ncbi:MAG: 50S ribosomal protein L6 [Bacteroidota bacterium]
MSRIGKKPIPLPEGTALLRPASGVIGIQGPKGTLYQPVHDAIAIAVDEGSITLARRTNQKAHKSLHGLYRALLANMVTGVSTGFKQTLELVGVGYKASVQKQVLELSLGYSHVIYFVLPAEVHVEAEATKGKNPLIHLMGIDKALIGQVAAKLKSLRKVEPYKGKGVRLLGEYVRRKAGKTATK